MAFDQNLEADRMDGFSLFSAFVRVPLLVLGGILGVDGSSVSKEVDSDLYTNRHGRNTEGDTTDHELDNTKRQKQQREPSNTTSMAHSIQRKSSEYIVDHYHDNSGMKRTKRMSWSDESGLPLVYENDEVRRENIDFYSVFSVFYFTMLYLCFLCIR